MSTIDTNSYTNVAVTTASTANVAAEQNKVAEQPAVQSAATSEQSAAPEDSVSLSDNASELVNTNEDGESAQVGGAGVVTTGNMTVDEMKTALATARGIDEKDVIVLSGTKEGDAIDVTPAKDGGIVVTINGKEHTYTAEQASRLIINGGDGDDSINVASNVANNLVIMGGAGDDRIQGGGGCDTIVGGAGNDTLLGGAGNDRITDDSGINKIFGQAGNDVLVAHSDATNPNGSYTNYIYGGSGNDYLEGGNGRDYMSGGDGYDVMYGLGGNDFMYGGAGNDYMDGGEGNDTLSGGAGDDNLVGGKGNDALYGNSGDDLLIGCSGKDIVEGGLGADSVITDGKDTVKSDSDDQATTTLPTIDVPDNFSIEGDEYQTARIASDLEFLASTPQGQMMLNSIADTGHHVTFDVTTGGSSCGSYTGLNSDPTQGSDSFVHYNTTKISLGGSAAYADRAPVVSMYHEMCHSYNAATGTMNMNYYKQPSGEKVASAGGGAAKGCEWQAVGLANPDVVANPTYLTENSLRDLLGYETRTRY